MVPEHDEHPLIIVVFLAQWQNFWARAAVLTAEEGQNVDVNDLNETEGRKLQKPGLLTEMPKSASTLMSKQKVQVLSTAAMRSPKQVKKN